MKRKHEEKLLQERVLPAILAIKRCEEFAKLTKRPSYLTHKCVKTNNRII